MTRVAISEICDDKMESFRSDLDHHNLSNCVRPAKNTVPGTGLVRPVAGPAQTGSKVLLCVQGPQLSDKIANRVRSNWILTDFDGFL